MKILIITSLFPPDTGVSTLRIKFFFEKLSIDYDVDILKLSDKTDFDGNIKTIESALFETLYATIRNRKKIQDVLQELIVCYDLIIISAPPYGLYEIGRLAIRLGKPVFFDLRDQPELIFYEKTKNSNAKKLFYYIRLKLTEKYILFCMRGAQAIFCAGLTSTQLLQSKLKASKNIYNVSNGFELKDINISTAVPYEKTDVITIGWGGNIYDFRDTVELRRLLLELDNLARKNKIRIVHWGSASESLTNYINSFEFLNYERHMHLPRNIYLEELAKVDFFILACSDSLIWEPTTTVFDYILYNKPVLYSGLRNNEACGVLNNCNVRVLYAGDVKHGDFVNYKVGEDFTLGENILQYSREIQFNILGNAVYKVALKANESSAKELK